MVPVLNFQSQLIVWFQKISIPHQKGSLEIPRGWGVQTKKLSVGGVWILSGTTH